MRCCSCFLVLFLVAGAFAAGFVLRGGVPSNPVAAALVAQARQAVGMPAPTPTSVPESTGSGVPVVQRNGNEVTIQLDEATLTQQANASLTGQPIGDTPLGSATVRNLAVRLRDGRIAADGTAQVGPTIAPVNVTATPRVESGRLRVAIDEAKVGGISLPAVMRQQIEGALQIVVDQVMAQQQIQVRAVSVADGKLIATGTAS